MRINRLASTAIIGSLTLTPALIHAATINTSDINIKLNARIQPIAIINNDDITSERDTTDFRLRRARILLKASMNNWLNGVIQTAYSEQAGSGSSDMRIVDAYIFAKPNTHLTVYAGQFLAPSQRQNITSAGSLMTFDRPGTAYKALTWGTRALTKFSTTTMNNTDAGLRGTVDVRDIGIMAIGTHSKNDSLHFKYYAGMFEGARTALSDRFVARAQLNFGDAESGFFQNSTYFGKKNTVSIGLSLDSQTNVAVNSENGLNVDYTLISADLFAEKPIGAISLTIEAAYTSLDLDDAGILLDPTTLTAINATQARQSQGQGGYIQSGLTLGKWQPWLGIETWESDGINNNGSYKAARIGATYLIDGNKANIKFGIEKLNAEHEFTSNFGATKETTTLCAGIFITF